MSRNTKIAFIHQSSNPFFNLISSSDRGIRKDKESKQDTADHTHTHTHTDMEPTIPPLQPDQKALIDDAIRKYVSQKNDQRRRLSYLDKVALAAQPFPPLSRKSPTPLAVTRCQPILLKSLSSDVFGTARFALNRHQDPYAFITQVGRTFSGRIMIRIRHRDWDGTLIDVVFTEHTQYIKAKHEGVIFDGACVLADLAGDELEGAIKIGLRRIPVDYGLEELEKVLGTYGFLVEAGRYAAERDDGTVEVDTGGYAILSHFEYFSGVSMLPVLPCRDGKGQSIRVNTIQNYSRRRLPWCQHPPVWFRRLG